MLSELEGKGWTVVDPPEEDDDLSVIGRYEGEPIRAGFRLERINDSDYELHEKYRSGQYDLEVKIDFGIGRGQVRVTRADGYGD